MRRPQVLNYKYNIYLVLLSSIILPGNKKSRTDLTYDKKYYSEKWGRRRGTKIGVFYTFFKRNFFLAKYLTIMHAFELFHLQKQRV